MSRVSHPCSGSNAQIMEPADTLSHWLGAGMPEHTGAKGTRATGMRLISYDRLDPELLECRAALEGKEAVQLSLVRIQTGALDSR